MPSDLRKGRGAYRCHYRYVDPDSAHSVDTTLTRRTDRLRLTTGAARELSEGAREPQPPVVSRSDPDARQRHESRSNIWRFSGGPSARCQRNPSAEGWKRLLGLINETLRQREPDTTDLEPLPRHRHGRGLDHAPAGDLHPQLL